MFERFSHVMFFSADVVAAANWYKEKLGFVENFVTPYYGSLRHEGMGCRLDLHGPHGCGSLEKQIGNWPMAYFHVRDIEAALAALKDKGIRVSEINQEQNSPRFASFWDRDGNELGVEEGR